MCVWSRSAEEEEKDEGMEEWDQDTLEKAVKQKHAGEKTNATKIICKYFIEAIEKKQYGWFWVCPNGGKDCQYRHALPPGYVLKSQMKQLMEEEMANKKSIEEEIEEERQKVDAATPLTEEVFRQWREKKMEERRAKEEKARAERIKGGRFTGREIFAMEGFEAVDDNRCGAEFPSSWWCGSTCQLIWATAPGRDQQTRAGAHGVVAVVLGAARNHGPSPQCAPAARLTRLSGRTAGRRMPPSGSTPLMQGGQQRISTRMGLTAQSLAVAPACSRWLHTLPGPFPWLQRKRKKYTCF